MSNDTFLFKKTPKNLFWFSEAWWHLVFRSIKKETLKSESERLSKEKSSLFLRYTLTSILLIDPYMELNLCVTIVSKKGSNINFANSKNCNDFRGQMHLTAAKKIKDVHLDFCAFIYDKFLSNQTIFDFEFCVFLILYFHHISLVLI